MAVHKEDNINMLVCDLRKIVKRNEREKYKIIRVESVKEFLENKQAAIIFFCNYISPLFHDKKILLRKISPIEAKNENEIVSIKVSQKNFH
jgi:hypothetical protein